MGKIIKWEEVKKISTFNWILFFGEFIIGVIIMLVGAKYIIHYIPDKEIVGIWLYLFHFMLGAIVMMKGMDWTLESATNLREKKSPSRKHNSRFKKSSKSIK